MRASPAYRYEASRKCIHCEKDYIATFKSQQYCSQRCRTDASTARRDRSAKGDWLRNPVTCGICQNVFFRTKLTGPNKKYCSVECTATARRRDIEAFKAANPTAMDDYNKERVRKYGSDTLITRLRKRYPDLPTCCEAAENGKACGEGRVIDIAHKPEFARKGAWRTLDKYERHMFWMLCPTHHAIIDRGACTPEEIGLTR